MKEFENLSKKELEAYLKQIKDRITEYESGGFNEKNYQKLLRQRIKINEKLDKIDEVIKAAIRKVKHPAKEEYDIVGNASIIIEAKNNFLTSSDAMVNTIDCKKGFESTERSATYEFIKRMNIEPSSLSEKTNHKKKGDFVIIEHPELSAPISYHILFYDDFKENKKLGLDELEVGIKKVLKDAEAKGLKKISFFPLGFDYVLLFPSPERHEVAFQLANRFAETIVTYLSNDKVSSLESIYFGCVSYKTMRTIDKAFHKWSSYSKQDLYIQKELSRIQKKLFDESHTSDIKFKDILTNIFYSINDNSTIVLLGETGVGKSYLAKILHKNSSRSSKPFISQNCAILQAERAESSLFGWIKGAYTGAITSGEGLFAQANGGTLFLDEVGTLDLNVQQMLLTFLDDGYFYKLGNYKTKEHSEIKLIFGTNANLEELVSNGLFLPDLYERIYQRVFIIPPLRERSGDIINLINYFEESLHQNSDYPIEIDDSAKEELSTYHWYGNTRQLKFYIENIFNKCKYQNINKITRNIIKKSPPRNKPLNIGLHFQLENLLKYYLHKWCKKDGSFLKDVIEPIVARIYEEDLKLGVRKSKEFLGLEGSQGKDTELHKQYAKYHDAIEKLKKL